MKKATLSRQTQGLCLAALLIALFAVTKGLWAQTIYKCDNRYSQAPCPGASMLNLNDARASAQKQQSDAATRRDAELAATLEKDRLAQEKLATARLPAASPMAAPATTQNDDGVVHKITPKRIATKHHKPKAFIAQVPGSEKKHSDGKSGKKKASAPD